VLLIINYRLITILNIFSKFLKLCYIISSLFILEFELYLVVVLVKLNSLTFSIALPVRPQGHTGCVQFDLSHAFDKFGIFRC
jgi:hypothetical protein